MAGHYGTTRRCRHYNQLSPMIQQIEDERIRQGFTGDRMDIEAGCCIGQYRRSLIEGRNISMMLLQRYAAALGKTWHLA